MDRTMDKLGDRRQLTVDNEVCPKKQPEDNKKRINQRNS